MSAPKTVKEYRQAQRDQQISEYCHLTTKLLATNQQGLSLPVIQTTVGISTKTAKRVLAGMADEKDGKYYPKLKGARK
ncbi:hypothetical protein [Moraxella nonliquefaciens]|uniref:hypothetical protein n=1 Tax=Moraxella nonliquefaciens TaxID=478 RepID=UPI001EF5D687|nr:hypothetical protein [Moraxella nonliquefaciens]MCG7412258.1 hypothetical protein [Moraxella nonliquefaciens]